MHVNALLTRAGFIGALAASVLSLGGTSTPANAWPIELEEGAPIDGPHHPINLLNVYAHLTERLFDSDQPIFRLTAPVPTEIPGAEDAQAPKLAGGGATASATADALPPVAQHDPDALHAMFAEDPKGPCLSVGRAHDGRLLNGVPLKTRPGVIARKGRNWGTSETVAAIYQAVDTVRALYPDTPDLAVGDLSRKHGGKLRPHKSHQSGRDADIAYYVMRRPHPGGLSHVSPKQLDAPRTFTFIESLLGAGVEYIFIDYRLQKPLYEYARDKAGKSESWLRKTFAYPRGRKARAVISHLRGHDTHLHVRLRSPEAVAAARSESNKAYKRAALSKIRGIHAESLDSRFLKVSHKVRRGESLIRIAKRYRVDLDDLLRWNRIKRSKLIRPGDRLTVYKKRVSRKSRRCKKKGKRRKGCPRS